MLLEVAALPFQAHANNGTWTIDFERNLLLPITVLDFLYTQANLSVILCQKTVCNVDIEYFGYKNKKQNQIWYRKSTKY